MRSQQSTTLGASGAGKQFPIHRAMAPWAFALLTALAACEGDPGAESLTPTGRALEATGAESDAGSAGREATTDPRGTVTDGGATDDPGRPGSLPEFEEGAT
jgi:hypothetical protein